MISFGKFIAKHRKMVLIIAFALIIPSVIGMVKTRVNYDILSYLPDNIETVEGQNLLVDKFGTGGFSMVIVEGMNDQDVIKLKEKIQKVDHVVDVYWYDDLADIDVPKSIFPKDIIKKFNTKDATMMVATFDDTTSADGTMQAVNTMRKIAKKQVFISGMSAIVADTKILTEQETPMYVAIAGILCLLILGLTMESFVIPFFFLISIAMAIVYNLGSNIMFGEISYITKALSAVLQLGVTMDYSIFLYHSYMEKKQKYTDDKERAMGHAISDTIVSVVGSSITTVAGFLALCFMTFGLGRDIGLVMAKGVVFGVICCITVLPSFILMFDNAIEKTKHREFIPNLDKVSHFVTKHYAIFALIFLVFLFPAIYGNNRTPVYYNLDSSLPAELESRIANSKLSDEFKMNTTHMLLVKDNLSDTKKTQLVKDVENVKGVEWVLGLNSVAGPAIPKDFIPTDLTNKLENGGFQLALVGSKYAVATDECNSQIKHITKLVKSYSKGSMLIGEGPLTNDLISITDKDFKTVSIVSIGIIFIIIMIIFKSISLPIILVAVIEFAIFINMGLPYYLNTQLPFIASIVIGTIQLGATVDYAILMTTRYRKERSRGLAKKEAVQVTHQACIKSIVASALSFFAATIGVGLYSKVDMISSLCSLMSRGAIISMVVVIFVLPSMYMIFDKIICKTSIGFLKNN